MIVGQNIDLPGCYEGAQVLFVLEMRDGLTLTMIAYAGSTGLCGYNTAGMGVCVNTLSTLKHSERGLPVNGVVRSVLGQPTAVGAEALLRGSAACFGTGVSACRCARRAERGRVRADRL